MSFILDALKKAESERHRASGPVLVDVRIAPPRRRLPAWAWVLGGILLANLAVLTWLMLRKPVPPATAAGVAAPALAPAATPAAAPAASPVAGPITLRPGPASEPLDPLIPPTTAPMYEPPDLPVLSPGSVNTANLRTAQELKAAGVALPPLAINVHSWGTTPAERYILLNGLRLMEGEFTPDGIKVEAITEEGAVLQARGQRFLLPRPSGG